LRIHTKRAGGNADYGREERSEDGQKHR
jgi:hypothetical protein